MSHGLLLVTVAAILQNGGIKDNSKPSFTSKVGGFSITMPGPPTESFRTEPTASGPLVNKVYQVLNDKAVFTVICADYPLETAPKDLDPLYAGIIQGYSQSPGSKILNQKKLKFEGVAARDVVLQMQAGLMHSRFFLKNKRIYQILVFFTDPADDNPVAFQKFADSFRAFPPVGKLTDGMEALTGWKTYRSKEGAYSALMLGDPKEQTQMLDTDAGQVEMKMTLCSNEKGENFGVAFSPVAKAVPPPPPETLYAAAVQGAATNLKGKILSRKAVEYQGRPGTEAQIGLPGTEPFVDGVFLVRMYWIGDRLYQVIYVGPRANVKTKEVMTFLDSFKLEDMNLKPAPAKGQKIKSLTE